jgi:hypothetical protein
MLSVTTTLFLYSCEKDNSEPPSLPVRTVIVYMIADNNLDNFAVNDINE